MLVESISPLTTHTPDTLRATLKRVAAGTRETFFDALRDGTLDPLFMRVESLELSEACCEALQAEGFRYVGHLLRQQDSYFLRSPTFLPHLQAMRRALTQRGLDFGRFFYDPVSAHLHNALLFAHDYAPSAIPNVLMSVDLDGCG